MRTARNYLWSNCAMLSSEPCLAYEIVFISRVYECTWHEWTWRRYFADAIRHNSTVASFASSTSYSLHTKRTITILEPQEQQNDGANRKPWIWISNAAVSDGESIANTIQHGYLIFPSSFCFSRNRDARDVCTNGVRASAPAVPSV